MNAVEIEEAISDLALQPFDAAEFPFAFLAAFGNKDTALKRLRTGNNNASDVPGGVLQRNNVHIAVCDAGTVGETLTALRASPATTKAKAKFILATDGQTLEAEELAGGETIACAYTDFPNHFGFFLPLAGISTIKEIRDNPIDVRATARLNKLYVELLRENPEWAKDERRADMNHFMARLVFCFFAEDTDIFNGEGMFTHTVEQMSERDGANTHEVMEAIFRAMNIKGGDRTHAQPRLPNWANGFPYVNGGLFAGATCVPRFTRMARTYLIHAGNLNWQQINPDIFGSMIQAVADDEERGALGMHYTSVPNILKVLTPGKTVFVDTNPEPLSALPKMLTGSMPRDGGHLIMSLDEADRLVSKAPEVAEFVRKYVGSEELINGKQRACLWIEDDEALAARNVPEISRRLAEVQAFRAQSPLDSTREFAGKHHRFVYLAGQSKERTIAVGSVSSEHREYLPVDLFPPTAVISNLALATYDAPVWVFSLIGSRLHLVWIAAVCGKLETRYRYSNTLGWNTFPRAAAHRTEQSRPNRLRRKYPAGARSAFPRHHRRPVRPGQHARQSAPCPRAQRRSAGAHLHRSPFQERYRAAGKIV